jgi:periplasmic divalent cation tolerance protein
MTSTPMETNCCLVLNTCPDQETAQKMATSLLETNLAACVSILPKVRSVYRWEGKIETSDEHMLLIKTTKMLFCALQEHILANHPYELPEIISVPISSGLDQYLDWIADNVR